MLPIVTDISVGPITFTPHGLFFVLGALVGALFLVRKREDLGLTIGDILERVFWIFFLGLLGARFTYFLAYPGSFQFIRDIVAIWEGGLVSFGGIIVGTALALWYSAKVPRGEAWLSAAARAFLLAWAVGRLGNFFALESAGIASSSWNFLYGTVPIQLFESLGCLVLFFIVGRLPALQLRYATLMGYLALRFIVDFWRDETVLNGLRVSQWVSLILFVALGVVYMLARRYREKARHGV